MPPRYAYWTILVDGQPTAFRSGSLEDIMPTFNRLKEKQPTAELKWFQNGQLWPSRNDAQDFMRARGARGREKDPRQGSDNAASGVSRSERPERAWNAKPDWKTRSSFSAKTTARPAPRGDKPAWMSKDDAGDKPTWTPKGDKPSFAKASEGKPEWKPKGDAADKPGWKPRSKDAVPEGRPFTGRRDEKSAWTPKGDKPEWTPASAKASARPASRDEKPEWKPKGTFKPAEAGHRSGGGDKPTWTPKGDKPSFAKASDGRPAWKPKGDAGGKPAWKPAASAGQARSDRKPEWKPKGTFKPKEAGHSTGWGEKPGMKREKGPVSEGRPFTGRRDDKPDWKPKGSPREQARATFRPKSYTPKGDVPEGRPSTGRQSDRPTWTPKGAARPGGPNAGFAKSESGDTPKRKWVPKAEYKKSLGIEVKRDDKWRPGGEHVDPKQKYKDAKKAKWTRVKATIRARSTGKPRKREE
ncbi:MAG: hypothetical protein WC815_09600 [Vicinamibacterales bacterium]